MVVALATHQAAMAQDGDAAALMAMDYDSLNGEIQSRFDDGLAASNNSAIVNANDSRYLWAIEAKAQCGIALGYLKSRTKDPVSIGKCVRAHQLMTFVPPVAPPPPPPPPPPPAPVCDDPKLIFFEFDVAEPPAEAQQVIDFVVGNYAQCEWQTLSVIGHADRSGSNSYNDALSQARAANVQSMLVQSGVASTNISIDFKGETEPRVPTEDGVRELQNRRVEIKVR
jgi:outer membrane protein OmpA-like peptidoglycan-associated protein